MADTALTFLRDFKETIIQYYNSLIFRHVLTSFLECEACPESYAFTTFFLRMHKEFSATEHFFIIAVSEKGRIKKRN